MLRPAMGAPTPLRDDSEISMPWTPSSSSPVDSSAASAGALGRVRRVMSEHPFTTALLSAGTGVLLAQGVPRGLRRLARARNRQAWAFFSRLVAESHPDNRGDGRFIRCFQQDIFKKLVSYEAAKGVEWGWATFKAEDVNAQVEKCAKEVGYPLPAGDAWRFRRGSLVRVAGTPGPPMSSMSSVALAPPPTLGQTHLRAHNAFGSSLYAGVGGAGEQLSRSHYDELRAAFREEGVGALLKMALPARGEANVNAGVAGLASHRAPALFKSGAGAMVPGTIR